MWDLRSYYENFFFSLNKISVFICLLIVIPILTLLERKVLSYCQKRKGPKKVSFLGLLQPIRDGIKLVLKNTFKPLFSNFFTMIFMSIGLFACMLIKWIIFFPIHSFLLDYSLRIILYLCINSLSAFFFLSSGVACNRLYAFLGSMRGVILVVSYEIALLSIIFLPTLLNFKLRFRLFFNNFMYIFIIFPIFLCWIISVVAEVNRAPFDFAEAERELVSGFKVDYSSLIFALLFLAEYGNIILVSFITSLLFFCPKNIMLPLSGNFIVLIILLLRARYPRWRIDFVMYFNWKKILPIVFFYIFALCFV